ncbi:PAS domain S-box protein [Candidatus Magnetomonas plexicatena]|uniref:PAS domain S-box protein n=1 Tax=Candidatus Magnetomonas plexicatena TaxID=2552947 RepID=UPI001C795C34|nr:PAS domain S-box protein [Nitrospirales bacterium LBB_01]
MRDEEKTKEQLIEELEQLRSVKHSNSNNDFINAAILELIATGVWVADENDIICYANEGMSNIAGVPVSDITGKHVLTDFPEKTLRFFRPFYLKAKQELSVVPYNDIPIQTPSLKPTYQSGRLKPLVINNLYKGMICIVDDVTEHKKAQDDIVQNKLFLEAVLDCIEDGIVACDGDGVLKLFNRATQKFHGLPVQPLLPDKWADYYDLYHDDGKTRMSMEEVPLYRTLKGEDITNVEMIIAPKNAPSYIISATGRVLRDTNGNNIGAVASMHDITEKKKAENDLIEAYKKLEKLQIMLTEDLRLQSEIMSNMAEGVILIKANDGNIVYCNPKFEQMFGYNNGELIGKHISIVNVPTKKTSEETSQEIIETLNKNGYWHGELQNIKKTGEHFWCFATVSTFNHHSHGKVWVSVHTDITERKKYQEDLNRFFNISIAMLCIADINGYFKVISPSWAKTLGYTEDELKSKPFIEFVHPDDVEKTLNEVRKLSHGVPTIYFVNRYLCKDGTYKHIAWTSAPVPDEGITYATAYDITQQKMFEAAVELERDKLKGILDIMEDGVYIVTKDHDIEFINKALANEFGEVNGRKCYEYFHDKTEQCSWCKNDDVFSGKSVSWEWHSSKNNKTYSLFGTPLKNVDGSVYKFEIFHDISDIKKAQATMKKELDFQTAIAELSEALLSHDKDIVDIANIVNRQATKLTDSAQGFVTEIDRNTGEDIGHNFTEIMVDGQCNVDTRNQRISFHKGQDGYNALWGHALNIKQGFYTNDPQKHPAYKGCIPSNHVTLSRYMAVPAIIGGRLIGQIAVANAERDYTDEDLNIIKRLTSIYALAVERKRMDEALRLEIVARQKTETLLKEREFDVIEAQGKAHFGVWTYDPVSQQPTWSLEMFNIWGRDTKLGPPHYSEHIKYIHPDDYQRFDDAVREAVEFGKPYNLELRLCHPDNNERIVITICEPILDAEGKVVKLRGSNLDITDRKQMEDELIRLNINLESAVVEETQKRRLNEQMLIQQSKMASMGEMIGLIAHQWKQPINAIGLNVQDLQESYTYGEVDDKYIGNLVGSTMQQIDFMAKTIDDFRNFFIPSKKKVLFDVKKAIEELLSMFINVFSKSDIDVSVKSDIDTVLLTDGYPSEFKQVILNILNNSKDAIVSKRKITPELQGRIEININNNEDKSKVIVSIKDNGGGIPEEVIGKIFEPYFTTKEKEGTGIGLYMSKTIIETNMGGSVTVQNVDGGAEFLISLDAFKT